MTIDPQARALNDAISAVNPHVYNMLSEKGRNIFFPHQGILAQSAQASGKAINATIGIALEDDASTMCLHGLADRISLDKNKFFGYAPSFGRPEIRALWRKLLFVKNPSLQGAAVSLPVVTGALTHGLSLAGYLFVNPGDAVIMPDLYWENYDLIFTNGYGAAIKTFPAFLDNSRFNVAGLLELLARPDNGKKIVLLNFPNNPTGYTVSAAEASAICLGLRQAADKGDDIVVLIDDAYFGLVFEKGIFTESLFSLLANAHERILAVKLDGPTKEDYAWGFRVGFMTFGVGGKQDGALYTALEAKLAGAVRGGISNVSNLSQSLLLAAYSGEGYDQEKKEKFLVLEKRYQKIKAILQEKKEYESCFSALPFNSGYFMCVKLINLEGERVRRRLLDNYDTGVIAFGPLLRIAFSSTPFNKLDMLFENIYQACRDERNGEN
ncbi:MAG: aminotransferase class I/II-fold pyridoxal phosphate-dependent enzyme [Chitinivibrionales bacterium]|nr:aminotransferase class I/II-fold pyridoxal phosphate-dependent enzyme [Chitinivibrionales bacterium]